MSYLIGTNSIYFAQVAVQSGDTIASTTTETNFATNKTIGANTLQPGKVIRVRARGVYSTDGISAGTMYFKLLFGTTALATTSTETRTNAMTNKGWEAEFIITIISATTAEIHGSAILQQTGGAVANIMGLYAVNTAVVTIDTTIDNTVNLAVKMSVSDADNSISMRQLLIEVFEPAI